MRRIWSYMLLLLSALLLAACGGQEQEKAPAEYQQESPSKEEKRSFGEMQWVKGLELAYANQFTAEKCGEYYLITIVSNDRFLLIPEGGTIPEGIPEDVITLQKPLEHVYLASSSVFDLIGRADAVDHIRCSGIKQEDLCVEEAGKAMEQGELLYAGKYSKPDYELLTKEKCDLAIENTMIYHTPEVKEKLESLGIPVLVETSSYEEHPFGRMEWIKLYGLLFDREEVATEFFEEQVAKLQPILQQEKTGRTVVFFYVNSNGVINVRKPGDYVAKMISLAGGEYVISTGSEEENALSTMNMQMEDFYLQARDADVIIYNSTIVGELESPDALVELNPLFADFKAVKENRVYCTAKNFFQETTAIGDFVEDLSRALRDENEDGFHQLIKLAK